MGFVGQARGARLIAQLTSLGVGEATQPYEFPPRRTPWFLDNGAFTQWRKGLPFDVAGFERAVSAARAHPAQPEWVVVPDVVADAPATLALAAEWVPRLRALGFRCALVVQDGMEPETWPLWDVADVVFVGGSLQWKLAEAHRWCRAAREHGKPCHIGRVGSARRVLWARSICADSIDSCVPLWSADNLRTWSSALLDAAPTQLQFGWTPPPATARRSA